MQRSNQFVQFSECGQRGKSRRGIRSRVLTCDHIPTAAVQGILRGRGCYRYCLTYSGGRISKWCRDLISSIRFLSEVNMKSRFVVYGEAI